MQGAKNLDERASTAVTPRTVTANPPDCHRMLALFSEKVLYLQAAIAQKEENEGTLQNNLTSARNSMRALLGKDSLLITRSESTPQK